MNHLSTSDKQYLESIGFEQYPRKYSGYYHRYDDIGVEVLIPCENDTFKLEVHFTDYDENGNPFGDVRTIFSKVGLKLNEFID